MKFEIMAVRYSLRIAIILSLSSLWYFSLPTSSVRAAEDKEISSTLRRFQDWCVNAQSLPETTQNLIAQMLKSAGTSDCGVAERKLLALEEINLQGDFADFRPIKALKRLKRLYVSNTTGADIEPDLQPFSQMTQLTHLRIWGMVKDIRPLARLNNLTYLDLSGNHIQDLQPISHLTNLVYLDLRGNHIARSDLEELSNLTKLRHFSIVSYQHHLNLSFLRNMSQLESLTIPDSGIQDLTPLAKLKNLKQLFLPNNPIQNILVLANLTSLTEIDLRNTQVQDFSPLDALPNLKYLQTGSISCRGKRCRTSFIAHQKRGDGGNVQVSLFANSPNSTTTLTRQNLNPRTLNFNQPSTSTFKPYDVLFKVTDRKSELTINLSPDRFFRSLMDLRSLSTCIHRSDDSI
jgi:internalin A